MFSARGLYAILDAASLGMDALVPAAVMTESLGVPWIQLRCKGASEEQVQEVAAECCARMQQPSDRLWVNDFVAVAAALPVRGVHLGQEDETPRVARRSLPASRLIGCSTHTDEQVMTADADPAIDVIAIGPVLSTTSKQDPEACVGWHGLQRARALTAKPLVAIGGLERSDYLRARSLGADLVAMIGALGSPEQLAHRVRRLVDLEVAGTESGESTTTGSMREQGGRE